MSGDYIDPTFAVIVICVVNSVAGWQMLSGWRKSSRENRRG